MSSTSRTFLCALLLLSLATSSCARNECTAAPPISNTPITDGLGVNIHFTDPQPGEIKMIADAGFRWVRMDFIWSLTETAAGQYDFTPYERLLAALEPHKIRALFILDYNHRLYDNGESPRTEAGRQAFARWAAAAAKHFQGRGIIWEMYNEPNHVFWRPQPNVDDYTKLALATAKAIRAAAPGETMIGPAAAGIDFSFLETCFQSGLLEYWAAVSVHPYRQSDPETVASDYSRLRQLIATYAPGKQIPIISGEWGYSAAWRGMNEEKQGERLARQWLINAANSIYISIWYDWHDDGENANEAEHHFGTVAYAYKAQGVANGDVYDAKPAYLAAKTLSTFFAGYRFVKRLQVGGPADYVLLFRKENDTRIAAWTTSPFPRPVTIKLSQSDLALTSASSSSNATPPPRQLKVIGHTGQEIAPVTFDQNQLVISVRSSPQYLAF
jgi:hypothetical protein